MEARGTSEVELRQYWKILRRRVWIVVLLPVIVLAASLALRQPAPLRFEATLRAIVDVPPLPVHEGMNFDPRYSAAQASEYLVDDFSELVTSQAFAEDVSARLVDQDIQIPGGVIRGSTASEQRHRVMTLWITWHDQEQAQAIAQAAADALQEDSDKYVARLSAGDAQVHVIDPPRVARLGPSLRERLEIPLRVALALVTGVGLAFLLDYLDDSVHEAGELEALGVSVLGEIPTPPGRRWLPSFLRSQSSNR